MNSILVRSTPAKPSLSTGSILVIEPDAERAGILRDILRPHIDVDLRIVARAEDAIRSITDQIPDLVMTSTFLPPAEEAVLSAHLRQMPEASHVQILNVPYFIDADASRSESPRSNVLGFLRRRAAMNRPRCDLSTLREQIQDYLDQAVANRLASIVRPLNLAGVPTQKMSGNGLVSGPGATGAMTALGADFRSPADHHANRRRASRRRGGELTGLWTIKLPWGADVKVVDISNRGVLFESASKIAAGTTVDLQLLGEETNIVVPARMVRAEVASINGLGVKYRMAAAFSRELRLIGFDPATGLASPRVLVDLLTRVLSEVDRPAGSSALGVRFESELRRLLPVRDIQIRETPVIAEKGAESIYFTVSQRLGSRRILQAVFEPGYAPSEMEFRLLKAAASLAAVVLELALLSDEPTHPTTHGLGGVACSE